MEFEYGFQEKNGIFLLFFEDRRLKQIPKNIEILNILDGYLFFKMWHKKCCNLAVITPTITHG